MKPNEIFAGQGCPASPGKDFVWPHGIFCVESCAIDVRFLMSPKPFEVLLVEDDLQMQDVLSALLAEDNIKLTAVKDGEAALDLVRKTNFELMVLDLGLPGKCDGFDVLRENKNAPGVGQRSAPLFF